MDGYYYVNTNFEDTKDKIMIEPYELARRNILDISIESLNGNDITDRCGAVVLEIDRQGIKDFATSLLIWANNIDDNKEFLLAQENNIEEGINLGVILTSDRISAKVRCKDLGTIFDYDSRFR